jgi:hypothetical protein
MQAANLQKVQSTSNFSEKTRVDDEGFLGLEEAKYTHDQHLDFDSGFSSVTLKDAKNETVYIDEKDEKKLVRKLDLRILPLFCLFYFADFLDRANIGNAT